MSKVNLTETEIEIENELKKAEKQKKIAEIMKTYEKDPQKGAEMMIMFLQKYVISFVYGPKYGCYARNGQNDDMTQMAYLKIIQELPKYDYTKTMPTTFFKPYIIEAIESIVRTTQGSSQYYAVQIRKIKQFINQRERDGKETTVHDCVIHFSDISPVTIKKCFDQMEYDNKVYINEFQEEGLMSHGVNIGVTPEEQTIKNEEKKELYSALNHLSSIEQHIIKLTYGLFTSDMQILNTILHEVTKYSPFELVRANGVEPTTILTAFGFNLEEILFMYGLSKSEAKKFAKGLSGENQLSSSELDYFEDFIHSSNAKKTFNENTYHMDKVIKTFRPNISKKEINDIISGKDYNMNDIKSVKDLNIIQLLRGKGFEEKDIEKILTGKTFSNAKAAILLPVDKKQIRLIQMKAMKKLQRTLKNGITDRFIQTDMDKMLNSEPVKCFDDTLEYVKQFEEDLLDIDLSDLDF